MCDDPIEIARIMLFSVLGVNVALVAGLFAFLKLDVIDTLYGSLQLFIVLQFTYFIIILQG